MTLLASNRALLDAFRRGEERAIEEVYRAYVPGVVSLLRRGFSFVSGGRAHSFHGIRDPWELECAVQDVFSRAFGVEARRAYDGVSPYAPYLAAVARNWAISMVRTSSREDRRRSALAAEGVFEPPTSPEQLAIAAERRALCAEFRASLPEELRQLLVLRYEEDRNLVEAARILGLSRMRARGRDRKLRELFAAFLRSRGLLGDGAAPPLLLVLLALGRASA